MVLGWIREKGTRMIRQWKRQPILFICFAIILAYRIAYLATCGGARLFEDSPAYTNFPFSNFIKFRFTSGRTPVYPLVIQLCRWLGREDTYLFNVVILQAAVSLLSALVLFKIIFILTKNDKIAAAGMLFYGLADSIIGWDTSILTESLSLSGTVFFLYLLIQFLNHPTEKSGTKLTVFTFVLVFLRPTFLAFFAVVGILFVGFALFERGFRKIALKSLIAVGAGTLLILVYSYNFSLYHEVFSITDASPRQQLLNSIQSGSYQYSSDTEVVELLDRALAESDNDVWSAMWMAQRTFGNARIQKFAQNSFRQAGDIYRNYLLGSWRYSFKDNYTSYDFTTSEYQYGALGRALRQFSRSLNVLSMYHSYLFCVVLLAACVVVWIRVKKIPWLHGVFFGLSSVIAFSPFMTTCSEYMRTAIDVIPFMIVGIAVPLRWLSKAGGIDAADRQETERVTG